MSIALVVVQPFADYAKGDRITDPAVVEKVLADHPHRVVKIAAPGVEQPAPQKPAAPPAPVAPAAPQTPAKE